MADILDRFISSFSGMSVLSWVIFSIIVLVALRLASRVR